MEREASTTPKFLVVLRGVCAVRRVYTVVMY